MYMERKPFSPLALAAFIAAVLGAIVFTRSVRIAVGENISPLLLYGIALGYLFTVLTLIFVWKSKAAKGAIDVNNYTAFWQNAVRYTLALDMIAFGADRSFATCNFTCRLVCSTTLLQPSLTKCRCGPLWGDIIPW
jgi:ABC-type Fe3+-siderophore transport system permease subunit